MRRIGGGGNGKVGDLSVSTASNSPGQKDLKNAWEMGGGGGKKKTTLLFKKTIDTGGIIRGRLLN